MRARMPETNKIYTGSKFFNKKIYIESFDDKELDAALKSVFHDHYHRTAPLSISRADCQLLLNSDKAVKEQKVGQLALFKKGM